MFFTLTLYIALFIFAAGLIYRVSSWFRLNLGATRASDATPLDRLSSALKGIFSTVFSNRVMTLLRVFFLEVLFQTRILKESSLRWIMHLCLFWGFMVLLLVHALGALTSAKIFPGYAPTLNPFLFLRAVAGLLVLVGLGISIYRRFILRKPRFFTSRMDRTVIILLTAVMLSGILLEGSKIVSFRIFGEMVDAYADFDDDVSRKALEAYWVQEFGVVSPDATGPFAVDTVNQGRDLHEVNCAACHSKPQWGFLGYGVSRLIRPVALPLDRSDVPSLLWYLHFLSSFFGLAYLPFSRMMHIFAAPLSLLVNSVMDREKSDPANIATRQILELDACTHCGTCTANCSVGIVFEEIPNRYILPSEKIASLKSLAAGKGLGEEDVHAIQEGLYLCTNCYRCTVSCPVGINLQELWFNVREAVLRKGRPELLVLTPFSVYRGLMQDAISEEAYKGALDFAKAAIIETWRGEDAPGRTIDSRDADRAFKKQLVRSLQGGTFSYCFTCTTCTTSCPVVQNFTDPPAALGLTPHQIIRCAVMGIPHIIYKCRMLWSCLGCYQCQEHCPQGVRVTDVLYELKNQAVQQLEDAEKQSIAKVRS